MQHAPVRAREQLEGSVGERRLRLPPVDVDDGQPAARAQHARELRDRLPGVEPVERLADEHRVDARVLERDRLGAARDRRAVHRAHALVRLDRDDAREPPRELPRQASRSRRQVEHARACVELERLLRAVERGSRVRWPDAVVRLGDGAEAQSEVLVAHVSSARIGKT